MCTHVQYLESLSVLGAETGQTGSSVSLTGMPGAQIGLTDEPTGLTGPAVPDSSISAPRVENSASDGLGHDKADIVDWWRPIINYLQDPSQRVDRKVWQLAFKFTLVDGDLYRRSTDDLL
jgi:hypothetical protein